MSALILDVVLTLRNEILRIFKNKSRTYNYIVYTSLLFFIVNSNYIITCICIEMENIDDDVTVCV